MRVSVVTPIYNNEEYLRDCLESLIRQTYGDIEYIFIDDGSTDKSFNIVKDYGNYPNVKIMSNTYNLGIVSAYKEAVKAATGDILCFLDADDIAHKDRVSRVVEEFQKDSNVGIVYSAMELIDKNGESYNLFARLPSYVTNDNLFFQLFRRNFFTGSALAIRNYDWLKFDLNDIICCDYYLCLQIAEKGLKFSYIDEPLVKYRIHGKNTSNNSKRMFQSVISVQNQYPYSYLQERWVNEGYSHEEILTSFGIMEYYYRKNEEQALKYFLAADDGGSKDENTYFYLGCIYFKKGDLKKSYFYFNKAFEIAPQRFQIVHNLGILTCMYLRDIEKGRNLLQ
uniref:glycosyltransferase n=1 Tax=Geobacillus sp. ZGt-1 TaxID=1631556 RepID=UPI00064999E9